MLALDGDPAAPGLAEADTGLTVDLRDVEAVLAAIGDRNVEWCVPAPLGAVLQTVGAVNDRLALPGLTAAGARASTDKRLFDQLIRATGARAPLRSHVTEAAHLARAVSTIGPPCVLKPQTGSGSRGVTVCRDRDDVDRAVADAVAADGGPWAVEELVTGPEVGVDGVVIDGRVHLVLVRDKTMTALPHRQELGYAVPTIHDEQPIRDELQRCVDALGLDRCALNADVIVTPTGPTVIELAGRPAGLLVAELLVRAAVDTDLLDVAIDLLTDDAEVRLPTHVVPTVLRFLDVAPGRVHRVPLADGLRNLPGVTHAEVWMEPGDELQPIRCAADVFARGVVIATGADRAEATANADRAVERARSELDLSDAVRIP